MTWDDVRQIARDTAAGLSWGSAATTPPSAIGEPLLLERIIRKLFNEPRRSAPAPRPDAPVVARPVMVVPTQGVYGAPGHRDRCSGWAVRLMPDGALEYLRFAASVRPDWNAPHPVPLELLQPFTPGADHWSPVTSQQLAKTDLHWDPENTVEVTKGDRSREWAITPTARPGASGTAIAAALTALGAAGAQTLDLREHQVADRPRSH